MDRGPEREIFNFLGPRKTAGDDTRRSQLQLLYLRHIRWR